MDSELKLMSNAGSNAPIAEFEVPEELQHELFKLMDDMSVKCVLDQPENIAQYLAVYLERRLKDREAKTLPDRARCLSYYRERSGGMLWRHMRYAWLNCEWTDERLVKYEKSVPAVYVLECDKTKLSVSDKVKVDGRFIKETTFAEVKTEDAELKPTAMESCFSVDGSVATFSNVVATEQDLKHIEGPKSDTLDDDIEILPDATRCLSNYNERPGEMIRRHIRYAWLNCKWTGERLIKYRKSKTGKTMLNVSEVDGRFVKETTFGVNAEVKTEITELKPTAMETCFGVDGSVTAFCNGVATEQDLKHIKAVETVKTSSQSGFKKMAKKIRNLFRRSVNKA